MQFWRLSERRGAEEEMLTAMLSCAVRVRSGSDERGGEGEEGLIRPMLRAEEALWEGWSKAGCWHAGRRKTTTTERRAAAWRARRQTGLRICEHRRACPHIQGNAAEVLLPPRMHSFAEAGQACGRPSPIRSARMHTGPGEADLDLVHCFRH